MLQPKRIKYRKQQKPRLKKMSLKGSTVCFGAYGLKAITGGRVTNRQIEAARIAMTRYMKREGQVWIRIFPDKPVTKKPIEVRMGKGKGNPEQWVAVCKPGMMLFEIDGVSEQIARESMRLADAKLGIRTRLVSRHGI